MSQEKVLGRAESPNESIEVLRAKLPEIMAVLFEEKVGFIDDEIKKRLKAFAAEIHVFTDKNSYIEFRIKEVDPKGLFRKNYTFMSFIAHLVMLDNIGLASFKNGKGLIFAEKGNKKAFLHEASHLIEEVVSHWVENGSLDATKAVELMHTTREDKTLGRAGKKREMISATGIVTSLIGCGILFAAEIGGKDIPTTNMSLLLASYIIFSASYFREKLQYLRLGSEKRARQAEQRANIFESSKEV